VVLLKFFEEHKHVLHSHPAQLLVLRAAGKPRRKDAAGMKTECTRCKLGRGFERWNDTAVRAVVRRSWGTD
jgi:hypothetical protein